MELIVAFYASHEGFAFSCYHKPLPCQHTFLDICQFLDVMDFKVSSFLLTVFTFVSVPPLKEFTSTCVFECERWCVYSVVEDRFALHVLGFEEFYFSSIPS